MRHHGDRLPRVARGDARHGAHTAGAEVDEALGALGREVGLALPPAPAGIGPALHDLVEGQALTHAEAALPQAFVSDDGAALRARHDLRRLDRAAEVAPVD